MAQQLVNSRGHVHRWSRQERQGGEGAALLALGWAGCAYLLWHNGRLHAALALQTLLTRCATALPLHRYRPQVNEELDRERQAAEEAERQRREAIEQQKAELRRLEEQRAQVGVGQRRLSCWQYAELG